MRSDATAAATPTKEALPPAVVKPDPKSFSDAELFGPAQPPDDDTPISIVAPIGSSQAPPQLTPPELTTEPTAGLPSSKDMAGIANHLSAPPVFATAFKPAAQAAPRRNWVGWVLLVVVLAIIGLGFWYFFLRGNAKPPYAAVASAAPIAPIMPAPVEVLAPVADVSKFDFRNLTLPKE